MKRSEPLWKRQLAKQLIQKEKDDIWRKLSPPPPPNYQKIMDQIIGVQPMAASSGKIFKMRNKYEEE